MRSLPITSRPDVDRLIEDVLPAFLELAGRAVRERGVFRVALSGGSTPKRLYERIATSGLDQSRVQWFWGDERNVPPDDPQSNYRMVHEALLAPAAVPAANVFAVPVQVDDPAGAAARYERTLRECFASATVVETLPAGFESQAQRFPHWDLVLLGLGDDVHTASLFPQSPALDIRDAWFVENWVEKFSAFRYTLTFPAINSAREIWFLVTGAAKREAMGRLLSGEKEPHLYPAQAIRPTHFFVTDDALPTDLPQR